MKVLKTLVLIGTIFCLFSLVSCSEDNETAPTRAELLAGVTEDGRSYFISSAEIDLIDLDGTLVLDECVTDNTIIYYPDGRYDENEGRTKCDAEDAPGSTGTWRFSDDEEEVIISINNETQVWTIESINDRSHRITRPTNDGELTFVLERFL